MVWHHVEADISSVVLLVVSLPLFISLSLSVRLLVLQSHNPLTFDVLTFTVWSSLCLAARSLPSKDKILRPAFVQSQGTKQLLLNIQLLSLLIFDACALPGAQYDYYSTCICVRLILWCELNKIYFLSSSTSFLTLQSIVCVYIQYLGNVYFIYTYPEPFMTPRKSHVFFSKISECC